MLPTDTSSPEYFAARNAAMSRVDLRALDAGDPLGIVAVALRELSAVNRYRVIFWHATYPYIWKHLQPGISPGKSVDEQPQ
jgi:hypothetical protein